MRRLWLILFVAMLPLQWSSAAVAALCLADAGHGAPRAAGHRHAMAHDAAGHAGAHARHAAAHQAHAHDAPAPALDAATPMRDAATPAHGAAMPAHDASAQANESADHAPDPAAAQAHDHGSPADCGGCCQAACQALPTRAARTQALADPQALPEQTARPIVPPALEGPFRPPRGLPA